MTHLPRFQVIQRYHLLSSHFEKILSVTNYFTIKIAYRLYSNEMPLSCKLKKNEIAATNTKFVAFS